VFDDGSRAVGEGCDWWGFSRGGFGILGLRGAAELVGQGHNHVFPDPIRWRVGISIGLRGCMRHLVNMDMQIA